MRGKFKGRSKRDARKSAPVGKSALDLDVLEESADAGEDVTATEDLFSKLHELADGVAAVADEFMELESDEGGCLGEVELEAASEAALGEAAGLEEEELVDVAGCDHGGSVVSPGAWLSYYYLNGSDK